MNNNAIKLLVLIFTTAIFISCNSNSNFKIEKHEIVENDSTYVNKVPEYLEFYDNHLYFINAKNDIFCLNIYDGKLSKISIDINSDSLIYNYFLNNPDSSVYLSWDSLYNSKYRVYSHLYKKHQFSSLKIVNGKLQILAFYTGLKVINQSTLKNFYTPVIITTNLNGKVIKTVGIKCINDSIYFSSEDGIFYDGKTVFISSDYKKVNYQYLPVTTCKLTSDGYDIKSVKHFPFPVDIWFIDQNEVHEYIQENRHVSIKNYFRKYNDSIYFLNGEKIFNYYTGQKFFEVKIKDSIDTTVNQIRSFDFFNPNNDKLLITLKRKLPKPAYFSAGINFLNLYNIEKNFDMIGSFNLGDSLSGIIADRKQHRVFAIKKENGISKLISIHAE